MEVKSELTTALFLNLGLSALGMRRRHAQQPIR